MGEFGAAGISISLYLARVEAVLGE
jgi:hypothetical protein